MNTDMRERVARAIARSEQCGSEENWQEFLPNADAVLSELGLAQAEPVGETTQWEGSDCVRWYDESKTLPVGAKLYAAPQPQAPEVRND